MTKERIFELKLNFNTLICITALLAITVRCLINILSTIYSTLQIDYFYVTQITITLFAWGLIISGLHTILENTQDSQKKVIPLTIRFIKKHRKILPDNRRQK